MANTGFKRLARHWPEFGLAASLAAFATLYALNGIQEQRHYANLRVEAEPFGWPSGCPPQAYSYRSEVPKTCAVHRYRIENSDQLGLVTSGRNTRWYRIGDDAFLLACFRLGDQCEVRDKATGKFVRSGYYRQLEDRAQGSPRRTTG